MPKRVNNSHLKQNMNTASAGVQPKNNNSMKSLSDLNKVGGPAAFARTAINLALQTEIAKIAMESGKKVAVAFIAARFGLSTEAAGQVLAIVLRATHMVTGVNLKSQQHLKELSNNKGDFYLSKLDTGKVKALAANHNNHMLLRSPNGSSMPITFNNGVNFGNNGFQITSITDRDGVMHTTISGQDYIDKVVGVQSAYTVDSFRLNPAQYMPFAWLSAIAAKYEQYRFTSLEFEFISKVPTTEAGSVYIYVDPDSSDPVPENERDFLTNTASIMKNVWDSFVYRVDPEIMCPKGAWKFTRPGDLPPDRDITTFDSGIVHIGFGDLPADLAGVAIGTLIVRYKLELQVAHQDERLAAALDTGIWLSTEFAAMGTVSATDIFGIGADTFVEVLRSVANPTLLNALFSRTGGTAGVDGAIKFLTPGFYTIDLDLVGTSPTVALHAASTVVGELFNAFSYGTEGRSVIISVHVTSANQILLFTIGGTVTATCCSINRGSTALDASNTVSASSIPMINSLPGETYKSNTKTSGPTYSDADGDDDIVKISKITGNSKLLNLARINRIAK